MTEFLTVGITVLASGVVAAIAAHFLSDRKEQRNFMMSKAEELYECFHKYKKSLDIYYVTFYRVILGKISHADADDILLKSNFGQGDAFDRMTMLREMYFPHTKSAFDDVDKARSSLIHLLGEHKNAVDSHSQPDRNWRDEYNRGVDEFGQACALCRAAVVSAGQKHLRSELLRMKR